MSPTFQEICDALRGLRGYDFEVLCNDYLKARYPTLTPLGISTKVPWTIPATLDAFLLDESGNLIACQYSAQENWYEKLHKDAQKVLSFAAANKLTVRQLIFCTVAEDDPATFAVAEQEVLNRCGFSTEICGLRRLATDLDNRYPGIAARRLGIPLRLQHFMTLDAYLDSLNQRYWPKRKDVEEGKLYSPGSYIETIEKKLFEKKRCLLSGVSGSGKTALAIAFSLWWRDNEENKRKHPEVVGFYLEASLGSGEEAGENWYREIIHTYDYQNELFLIDNCHLAPLAVNSFCRQWERRRPEQALVLLISAPKVSESPWEGEPEDYFDGFEQEETIVGVLPEQIYSGMLRTYSHFYCRTDPERFVSVNEDLGNHEHMERLEHLCAHNLAVAHSLLEVWGDIGGRLSDITEEVALDALARRYLTQDKALALAPLCGLAQFEIAAHDRFVNQLPRESVAALRRENLLATIDTPIYGRCHRIAFHPQVAAQIFRAHIKQQVGIGYESHADNETFSLLKTYLSAQPGNFAEAYYRLYRVGTTELQHRLLNDAESQTYAVAQFTNRPLNEVVRYLYSLYHTDTNRAVSLLQDFLGEIDDETLHKQVLALTGSQFFAIAQCLPKMSPDLARTVLGNLTAQWVVDRIAFSRPRVISRWISPTPSSIAVQLGYSKAWSQEVAEALDLTQLAIRAQQGSLQDLYWLLRDLRRVASPVADNLLTQITLAGLADMFRKREARVQDLVSLFKVCDRDFAKSFVSQFSLDEVSVVLARSPLGEIGALLEYRYRYFQESYAIFASQYLPGRLATDGIDEIGKFIARLQRVPQERKQLAMEAFDLLLATDLAARVAETDVEQLAVLLYNAYSLDPSYPQWLLTVLAPSKAIEKALEHSGIRGIQLLLHNLSDMAPTFVANIGQALQTVDLTGRIAEAEAKDLRHFLWSVQANLGAGLAQKYCRIVDAQLRSEQIMNTDLMELGNFLWNLVHISDMEDLQTLSKSALRERLQNELGSHPGSCVRILGIIVTVRPNAAKELNIPSFNFKRMLEGLTEWLLELLSEKHPHAFAQTVKGLQALDESQAIEIVQKALHQESAVNECISLLKEAIEQALTPRSRAILEEVIRFIQQLK